ncbi:unnamed protein product [Bursaphelenchus okinawaensis]|uniref:TAR DNA-binding protein 43 N-terminal domain-containing protein n=1 Tax=Bursaphelenchus okinawaensis TaxID=465554 RepID=A0A811K9Q0_9BILA|nr:unnamed protein product [Bursaphelenchus okinawaensis]CAG9098170.1 unnamed protein product [Bursaphelenchus okinawaensis]
MYIRVEVEPCDLELSANQLLPLTSLQSAFPGAVGISYKTLKGVKRALRFDGISFHAPEDGWQEADEYTVQLSGKNSFPFDSYENASKQFERAVNMVQKLIEQGYGDMSYLAPSSPPSPGSASPRERLKAFRRKIADYRVSNDDLTAGFDSPKTELEKQFSELSAILVGKDAIIDTLRKRLDTVNQELNGQEDHEHCRGEIQKWRHQVETLEDELKLFREMASKQENVTNKVKSLTNELEELRNTSNTKIQSIHTEYERVCREMREFQRQHELLLEEHSRTTAQLHETEQQLYDMKHLLDDVRQRFEESEQSYAEQIRTATELQERMCNENVKLLKRINEMENETQGLKKVTELQSTQRSNSYSNLKEKYTALMEEHEEKINETASLNQLIENLNRHLTDITVKYKDLRSTRDESPKNRYYM